MRLALWQGFSPAGDLNTACAQAEAAVAAAGAMGATALVLPEIWLPGYNQSDIPDRALPLDSPSLHRLAGAAKAAQTALVIGYAERDGASLYNSAVCFGPDGSILLNYRKAQLYGPRETALYTAGDKLLVALSEMIRSVVPEDALAARLGGDEFLILFNNASNERIVAMGNALREQFHSAAVQSFSTPQAVTRQLAATSTTRPSLADAACRSVRHDEHGP